MTRNRVVAAIIAAAALSVGVAGPASAAPTHRSCADWGHAFADWAQSEPGAAGAGMSALGASGPGVAASVVHDEQAGEYAGYGVPGCAAH